MGLIKKHFQRYAKFFLALKRMDEISKKADFLFDLERYRADGIELPLEAACFWTGRSKVAEVEVGSLMVVEWTSDGLRRHVPIADFCLSLFLQSRSEESWAHYLEFHAKARRMLEPGYSPTPEGFAFADELSSKGYDPSLKCIVVRKNNVVVDGQHRAASLLYRFGPGYKVKIVRILD